MSKHTPGPWLIWTDKNGCFQVGPSPNYSVANMWCPPNGEQKANARLISAAPDLVRLLIAAMKDADNPSDWFYEAKNIIAKATGETT